MWWEKGEHDVGKRVGRQVGYELDCRCMEDGWRRVRRHTFIAGNLSMYCTTVVSGRKDPTDGHIIISQRGRGNYITGLPTIVRDAVKTIIA